MKRVQPKYLNQGFAQAIWDATATLEFLWSTLHSAKIVWWQFSMPSSAKDSAYNRDPCIKDVVTTWQY